jgi:hypothetical protein
MASFSFIFLWMPQAAQEIGASRVTYMLPNVIFLTRKVRLAAAIA